MFHDEPPLVTQHQLGWKPQCGGLITACGGKSFRHGGKIMLRSKPLESPTNLSVSAANSRRYFPACFSASSCTLSSTTDATGTAFGRVPALTNRFSIHSIRSSGIDSVGSICLLLSV